MLPDVIVPVVVAQIREMHRQRCFVMEVRKRADLSLGSSLRSWLGWRNDLEKDEATRIKNLAVKLVQCGSLLSKGKDHELSTTKEWANFGEVVIAALASRRPTDIFEKKLTSEMERLAKMLPVWDSFGKDVKGFGARSLAVIVGEAGDLSNYSKESKLWKRMGLAVMDGRRQGNVEKGLPIEQRNAKYIEHGYNPNRRARMFVIGDSLIKQNDGAYRLSYDARKKYERRRAVSNGLIVAPATKIPAKRKHEFMSDGHIHHRSQRYMEKRLLRDLWKAWQRTMI